VKENNIAVGLRDLYVAARDIRVRGNFGCGEVGTGLGIEVPATSWTPPRDRSKGTLSGWASVHGFAPLGSVVGSMLFIKGGS
jgi:hypothetical protein